MSQPFLIYHTVWVISVQLSCLYRWFKHTMNHWLVASLCCGLYAVLWGAFVCLNRQGLLALGWWLLYAPFVTEHTLNPLISVWFVIWFPVRWQSLWPKLVTCSTHMIVRTNLIILHLMFRFLGSTKIPLKDLSSGQVRSLPSRNVPLVNESGQNIGVSLTHTGNCKTISFLKNQW